MEKNHTGAASNPPVRRTAKSAAAARQARLRREQIRKRKRRQKILRISLLLALIAALAVAVILIFRALNKPDVTGEPKETDISAVQTATPEPTATLVPTPVPTSTPIPTPTPVPTSTPIPTPTPVPVKLEYPYLIEVDKSRQIVTVYTVGKEGYYDLMVKQFICSTGHCDKVEDGMYTIGEKYRWKQMGNGSYAQYASRISGPYLFHSCCYYSMNSGKMKTRYYNNLGTNASSGCIRLTCASALWIYENCPKGTPIHVITSGLPKDDALLQSLKPEMLNSNWDPTDPETKEKYRVTPSPDATPDPTPYPGVTPAPTPKWTVHPTLKEWGYC